MVSVDLYVKNSCTLLLFLIFAGKASSLLNGLQCCLIFNLEFGLNFRFPDSDATLEEHGKYFVLYASRHKSTKCRIRDICRPFFQEVSQPSGKIGSQLLPILLLKNIPFSRLSRFKKVEEGFKHFCLKWYNCKNLVKAHAKRRITQRWSGALKHSKHLR